MPAQPFRVLFVCHANLCRSPMAEHILRSAVIGRWGSTIARDWVIQSAGTHARIDEPIDESAGLVLAEIGISAEDFRSRQLTASMVRRADLVLTAEKSQRAAALALDPRAIQRTFTVREFAHLTGTLRQVQAESIPDLGRLVVSEAKRMRSHVRPLSADETDIEDPIGGPLKPFRQCTDLLTECARSVLECLTLVLRERR